MTVFEFANVLWSILFSVAFAHMLSSVAGLVHAGGRVRWSWLHALWWLSVFICVIANWISLWDLRNLPEWTTGYILLLLLATFLQYLTCYLVSPEIPAGGEINLDEFHTQQSGRYLAAFGLLNAISIPLNIVTADMFGVSSWGWQNLAQAPAAALTFGAIFLRRRWVQWALAISVLGLSGLYLLGLQNTIR